MSNLSINLGKLPIDDIPIANKGKRTFEQLLEDELAREAKGSLAKAKILPELPKISFREEVDENKSPTAQDPNKRAFLKRSRDTAQKSQHSTTKKSYRYYADSFQEKRGEQDSKKTLNRYETVLKTNDASGGSTTRNHDKLPGKVNTLNTEGSVTKKHDSQTATKAR